MKEKSLLKIRWLFGFQTLGLVYFTLAYSYGFLPQYGVDLLIFTPKVISLVGAIFLGLSICFVSSILRGERE